MRSYRKSILTFLLVLLLVFVGFSRDFVFKSINALIKAYDYDLPYSLHPSLSFLERFDAQGLIKFKWIFTIFFSLVYLLITVYSVNLFFKKRKYLFITAASYLTLFIISGIFILTGLVMKSNAEKMYEFARYLMGMLQSPIILMILIPAFKLVEKNNSKTTE